MIEGNGNQLTPSICVLRQGQGTEAEYCSKPMLPMKRTAEKIKQPLRNMMKFCPSLRNKTLDFLKSERTEAERV